MMMKQEPVFKKIIANQDIEDFFRMINLGRLVFKEEPIAINIMPGGLTNKNFKLDLSDGSSLAVRVAGHGTANYINRPAEKHNAGEMATIGIAPKIHYYDPETGSQLVEYIDADTMHDIDFQTRDDVLVACAKIMNKYHNSGLHFISRFDPCEKIETYIKIIKEHKYPRFYEHWDKIIDTIERVQKVYIKNPPKLVPCHNDTLAMNFMYDGEIMRVIDWEYGGMNDAYFDIACVIVENPLNEACEKVLVNAYCDGHPTEEQLARVLINKFLVTTHWSTWSLVQICYGKEEDFYWEYGRVRAEQAYSFLTDPNFDRYLDLIG